MQIKLTQIKCEEGEWILTPETNPDISADITVLYKGKPLKNFVTALVIRGEF